MHKRKAHAKYSIDLDLIPCLSINFNGLLKRSLINCFNLGQHSACISASYERLQLWHLLSHSGTGELVARSNNKLPDICRQGMTDVLLPITASTHRTYSAFQLEIFMSVSIYDIWRKNVGQLYYLCIFECHRKREGCYYSTKQNGHK